MLCTKIDCTEKTAVMMCTEKASITYQIRNYLGRFDSEPIDFSFIFREEKGQYLLEIFIAVHVVCPQQAIEVYVAVLIRGVQVMLFTFPDHGAFQQTGAFQSQLQCIHPAPSQHKKKKKQTDKINITSLQYATTFSVY